MPRKTTEQRLSDADKKADELHQQIYGDKDTSKEALDGKDQPTEPGADGEGHGDEAAPGTKAEERGDTSAGQQQPAGQQDELPRLKQAYSTLQAKYNAEVPRMAAEIKDLKAQLADATQRHQQAQQQLDTSETGRREAEQKAEAAKGEMEQVLAKIREEYGEDEPLSRAFNEVDKRANTLERDTQQVQQSVEAQSKRTAASFWRRLRRAIPDFEEVNNSRQFVEWLSHPGLEAGKTIKEELNEAGADFDADTVIEIFADFKKDVSGSQYEQERRIQQEEEVRQRQQQRNDGAPELDPPEQQVGQRSRAVRDPGQKQDRYTIADWNALQREAQNGKWVGREKAFEALERKIMADINGR